MIYCFDLDGTLCQTEKVDYMRAEPFQERIERVNSLYDEGHTIIIETARGSVSGEDWFKETKKQLKSWGLKYNFLRTGMKQNADIYIDDKGKHSDDFFKDKI
jgi:hydroxymethylpyrimidine pyrophosphatase-like HAD family hydrolase